MACIFIVENHDWVRNALAEMVARETGIDICGTAASAEEALEALPDKAEVVLVDIGMDGMSGIELVKVISERWPHLRTVVLTNHPAESFEQIAREAGATSYIEKGDAPALLAAIAHAMDQHAVDDVKSGDR